MSRRDDRSAAQNSLSLEKRREERQAARAAKFISDNQPIRLFGATNPRPRLSLLETPQESVELLRDGNVPTSDLDHDLWTEQALLDDPSFAFPWPLPPAAIEQLTDSFPDAARLEVAYLVVQGARSLRAERLRVGARGYVTDQPVREISDLRDALRLVQTFRDRLSGPARDYLGTASAETLAALKMIDAALLNDQALQALPTDNSPDGHTGRRTEKHIALQLNDAFVRAFAGERKPFSFHLWHNQCRAALGLSELIEKSTHEKFMRRARTGQIDP